MDNAIAKRIDISASPNTGMIRVGIRVGGLATAVWLASNALAGSVYLFDKHSHSHPGLDIFVVHSGEIIASLLLLRYYNLNWRDAGFQFQTRKIRWFSGTVLVVLLNLSLAGFMRAFHTPETYAGFSQVEKLLLLCAYVPVSEEIFVRGWFQAALLQRAGERKAIFSILGSSILFAGTHLFVGGGPIGTVATVAGAFFVGLVAASLRHRSGSLLPAIAVHAMYNITGLFLAVPIWSFLTSVRG